MYNMCEITISYWMLILSLLYKAWEKLAHWFIHLSPQTSLQELFAKAYFFHDMMSFLVVTMVSWQVEIKKRVIFYIAILHHFTVKGCWSFFR